MQIFLVRHAIAVARADPTLDHARPLTPAGRKRFEKIAAGLGALAVRFDTLLTSPWTRAVQTADLLRTLSEGAPGVTEHLAAPPGDALLARLAREPEDASVALVGHEPFLGTLLAWLTVGDPDAGDAFPFKKGGVAHLEGGPEPGRCALRAHLPPKSLRKLADGLN